MSGGGWSWRAALALALGLAAIPLVARADGGEVDYAFLPVTSAREPAAQPMPKYQFMFGDPARWPGVYRWRYNPQGAPAPFALDVAATVADLVRTFDAWTQGCGVRHEYLGETTTVPNARVPFAGRDQPDFENVVGWGPLAGRTAGVTYAWYVPASGVRDLVDADVVLSPDLVTSGGVMERVAKHEWGHALGLAHSDRNGALMSGPPDSTYNTLSALRFDDVRGCRCLYGPSPAQPAGYSCSVPHVVDFGLVPLDAPSLARAITLANDGNGVLALQGRSFAGGGAAAEGCAPGTQLLPGASCSLRLVVTAGSEAPHENELTIDTSDGPYVVKIRHGGAGIAATGTVELVEYFHAGFGHYFVTYLPGEIRSLDDGTLEGWSRTGRTIRAWAALQDQAASWPVCRFFSARFAPKSSHFYTASVDECATVRRNPDWQFEGEVFHLALPDVTGACAAGTRPVYRLYNDGASGAPNHRFTTDAGLRDAMIAQGWRPEGAASGVAMCAPL